jgi:hypothetical protein
VSEIAASNLPGLRHPIPKLFASVQREILANVPTFNRGKMLKVTRTANGEVVFTISGRMEAENVSELESLFRSETKPVRMILDLTNLSLVDQGAVKFLERCESEGVVLKNCPAYIREWITRRRNQRDPLK